MESTGCFKTPAPAESMTGGHWDSYVGGIDTFTTRLRLNIRK